MPYGDYNVSYTLKGPVYDKGSSSRNNVINTEYAEGEPAGYFNCFRGVPMLAGVTYEITFTANPVEAAAGSGWLCFRKNTERTATAIQVDTAVKLQNNLFGAFTAPESGFYKLAVDSREGSTGRTAWGRVSAVYGVEEQSAYTPEFKANEQVESEPFYLNKGETALVDVYFNGSDIVLSGDLTIQRVENPYPEFAEADILELGVSQEAVIDTAGAKHYAAFTPEEDGTYVFYSFEIDGDPKATLYDENHRELANGDDEIEYSNSFMITYDCQAGKTYYLESSLWNGTGSYLVRVRKDTDNPIHMTSCYNSSYGTVYAYTGNPVEPDFAVRLSGTDTLLVKDVDYTLLYENNTDIGKAKVIIRGLGGYDGQIDDTFTIKGSITDAVVTGITDKIYTGEAITQSPVVTFGGVTLTAGTDYTVTYDNNVNVGTAAVIITGKGNYSGSNTATFKINRAAQTVTAKASAASVAVGKTVTISVSGTKESPKLTYKSSNTGIATVSAAGKVTAKKVGTVKITVTAGATTNYAAKSATVTIKVVPAATTSVAAANLATGMKVTWKKVTGATGYKIYRNGTLVKKITSGSTVTYSDTKANTNGSKYIFKVVAFAATGDSTLYKSVTTYRVARPAISSLTSPKTKQMTVKWGKNAKATGYQIQYSLNSKFASGNKTVTVKGAAAVSKTISSLTAKKRYYVRVRTYKTVSGKNYYSAWSAVKNVITK